MRMRGMPMNESRPPGCLECLSEPPLFFGFGQPMTDPREGLTLFGPLDESRPPGITMGVAGTPEGIQRAVKFVKSLQSTVHPTEAKRNRPFYPGFESVFGIPWNHVPYQLATINAQTLHRAAHEADRHQRVYDTATLYADAILEQGRESDSSVSLWLVVVPPYVWKNCRPNQSIPKTMRTRGKQAIGQAEARRRDSEPMFDFEEWKGDDEAYKFDPDFRNQLKYRLLEKGIPTQIVREDTIAWREFTNDRGRPKRDLSVLESQIAWNLSSAVFYKAGGKPWNLGNVRKGVCYIGLVFKQLDRQKDERTACCAAQMFLNSGDGVVFKGDVGPWYNPKRGDYHLDRKAAFELVTTALNSYRIASQHEPPKELFIHGRTFFSDDEWTGFKEAGGKDTKVVGVRISKDNYFRLYHSSDNPVMRGTALIRSESKAVLCTKGWVPRLQTFPGSEVPVPLSVEVIRGDADIRLVLRDILALTKLNYNACSFADGMPVTLRFADAVGEILAAGEHRATPPLSFKFYI